MIGKGSHRQSAHDKATSLRLLLGVPFGLKAETLNQQGRIDKEPSLFGLAGLLIAQFQLLQVPPVVE